MGIAGKVVLIKELRALAGSRGFVRLDSLAQDRTPHPDWWPVSTLYFQCIELDRVIWQVSAGGEFEGNGSSFFRVAGLAHVEPADDL
jgi:hypothetical protein